jgi:hypothetical protein
MPSFGIPMFLPSIVMLDGSGRETGRITGTGPSSPIVYSSMQKAAEPTYKSSLVALVEAYSAFLKKFDKVQGQVSDLETAIGATTQHLAEHDCEPGRKQLKEQEAEIKPLQAEREKLLEQEKALLTPALKAKETAAAPKN